MVAWHPPSAAELRALDRLGTGGTWTVAGAEVRLTNLDKVLFPARPGGDPVTKRDLVRYQACIAPYLLPYLHDRPVNLHRFPDGAGHDGFWAKSRPEEAPSWLTGWDDPDARPGRTRRYAILDHPAALAYVANLAALELHPWTSTAKHPAQPSWALVDIDPGTCTTWEQTVELARLHRTALAHLEVEAAPKVTGKRGIQIWIPVRDGLTFADTAEWVEALSRAVGAIVPDLVSWSWRVDERQGRARLDHTQNARNKTLVAPFSPRPAAGAPVSMPITWEELDDPDLSPDRWTIRTALERLDRDGDPLRPLIGLQQDLPRLS